MSTFEFIDARAVYTEIEQNVAYLIPSASNEFNNKARVSSFRPELHKNTRNPFLLMYLLKNEIKFDRCLSALGINSNEETRVLSKNYEWEQCDNLFVACPPRNPQGWLKKIEMSLLRFKSITIVLPARTDSTWFHENILSNSSAICRFIEGRVSFTPNGAPERDGSVIVTFYNSPAHTVNSVQCPSCLFTFDEQTNATLKSGNTRVHEIMTSVTFEN